VINMESFTYNKKNAEELLHSELKMGRNHPSYYACNRIPKRLAYLQRKGGFPNEKNMSSLQRGEK
jgi:hypothetical protein